MSPLLWSLSYLAAPETIPDRRAALAKRAHVLPASATV